MLAHDWLVGLRGGELVLDRLAQLFGPTTIHTLVSDGRPLTEAIDACRVAASPLQRLPGASGRLRRWYFPLMPWAVERLRVEPCDLVISTSSAVMKSIQPPPGARHLCYCHSPARYVWGQTDDYRGGSLGAVRAWGLRRMRRRFRAWDRRTAERVTRFVANSEHTAQRIASAYGREAAVVHPPVRTDLFTPDSGTPREDWLLVVSALEPYKRVDLAIEAARRGGWRLRIAGAGSQRSALDRVAPPGVELLGRVDDEALVGLYRRARALLYPQQEDFGITAIEAQATGCPVIALAAGGALDTVTEQTGVLFLEQTADAIVDAVRRLDRSAIDPAACRANAERFGEDVFDRRMMEEVGEMLT